MGEHVSSYTGKRIDELLKIVDENSAALKVTKKPLGIAYGGTGASDASSALTNIGAASVNHTHESVNQILWEGASYMNRKQKYSFINDAKVSDQPHGIVLVFSCYDKDAETALDYGWSTHFVPKYLTAKEGYHTFLMANNYDNSSVSFGAKQLYISNTEIGGHEWNDVNTTSGTNGNDSNIAFRNGNYVLRYVIGV